MPDDELDAVVIEPIEPIKPTEPEGDTKGDAKDDPKPPTKKDIVFKDLSPELQSYIDSRITGASKTAREHALTDPQIREQIKLELEADAKLTAEQKVEKRMLELQKKTNELDAKEYLMREGNLYGEDLTDALELVVTDDPERTKARAEKYVTRLSRMVDTQTQAKVKELIKGQPKPITPATKSKDYVNMNMQERIQLKKTDPARFKAEADKHRSKI